VNPGKLTQRCFKNFSFPSQTVSLENSSIIWCVFQYNGLCHPQKFSNWRLDEFSTNKVRLMTWFRLNWMRIHEILMDEFSSRTFQLMARKLTFPKNFWMSFPGFTSKGWKLKIYLPLNMINWKMQKISSFLVRIPDSIWWSISWSMAFNGDTFGCWNWICF